MPEAAGFDFVASPLVRARARPWRSSAPRWASTAEAYRADDRLARLTFGAWEGLDAGRGSARTLSAELMAAREKDKWSFLPPGGESYEMLSERVADWLGDVTRPTFVVCPWRRRPRAPAAW